VHRLLGLSYHSPVSCNPDVCHWGSY
jgi:hypothetical protein